MNDEINNKHLVALVPVIKSPELIKVKTISPKIVEALKWNDMTAKFDWSGQEIIGRLEPSGLLLRHINGRISKVGEILYIEARMKNLEEGGTDHKTAVRMANEEVASFPQIFPV